MPTRQQLEEFYTKPRKMTQTPSRLPIAGKHLVHWGVGMLLGGITADPHFSIMVAQVIGVVMIVIGQGIVWMMKRKDIRWY